MKKIFITREIPQNGIKILEDKGYKVTVSKKKRPLTHKELIKELKKDTYDVVVPNVTDPIDAETFDASPSTKLFASYSIGFNNYDIEASKERGITIANAPGDYVDGIAEYSIALLLSVMFRIKEADKFMCAGKYKGWDPMLLLGENIKGKTVAVIGTGRIGEKVASKLYHGFGANIVYYDIVKNEKIEAECNAKLMPKVEEALKVADIVSIHVPLLESTRHLINKERIALMKDGAFILNTSRGPVIDEKELVKALKAGKIKGAGLDVYEFEPKLCKGLNKLPNVVLSPHIASGQIAGREEMAKVMAQNIIDFFEGKELKNKVN